MRVRYTQWTEEGKTPDEILEELIRIFTYLLTKTDGDVSETLEWMKTLDGEYDLFPPGFSMERFVRELEERGLIRQESGRTELTARGAQRIRSDALSEIFRSLRGSATGYHETPRTGPGLDPQGESREYRFGDPPSHIDFTRTLMNAYTRHGPDGFDLREEDIAVHETEAQLSCATVLMLDISHSMILYGEDRITPAKRVALALSELITTRYPKDRFSIILFGDDAREVSVGDLTFAGAGPYHTNTREGLRLARSLLRKSGNAGKRIFMITDGKPSAIFESSGRLYKNSLGLDPRIVNRTLDEAVVCRKEGIVITTFMVARDPALVTFVDELARVNKGKAYFTGAGKLGEYVLVDYIRNRRKILR